MIQGLITEGTRLGESPAPLQDGQALSSRQNIPANAKHSHARRNGVVSAFGCGTVDGRAARRKKARTGSSNGTGTRAPRLVGGLEVKGATSAGELVLETSKFPGGRKEWT